MQRVERQLAGYRGIRQARVATAPETVNGSAVLDLTYDPTVLSLAELRRQVDEEGAGFASMVTQMTLPVTGILSPRKEGVIEARLNRLPGVSASASFAAQTIRVEFDRWGCPMARIVRELEREGVSLRGPAEPPATFHITWLRRAWTLAGEQLQLSTAVAGGVLLAIGTAVYLAGGPEPLRLALAGLAYGLCGWMIAWETLKTLARFRVDIDVLMFAAAIGAALLGHFEEGALLLLLFSLGESGERLAIGRARRAIEALSKIAPQTATRIAEDADELVHVEDLAVGDRIRIATDEQIPADAEVLEGESAVDQAPITGESVPVEKRPGDPLFAGTFNGSGPLVAVVTKLASENTLSKVIRLVEEAQTSKSPTQRLAERFERWYVPVVLATTGVLVVVPPLLGITPRQQDGALWAGWFYQAMAFLTAASPCALAIGTPAAILSGIGKAARLGVLVKGGVHLENLANLRAIGFDKTGTLTRGKPRVTHIETLTSTFDADRLLSLTAAIEQTTTHPLARAIVDEAQARGLDLPDASHSRRIAGQGMEGRIGPHRVEIGSTASFEGRLTPGARERIAELRRSGHTMVCIGVDDELVGLIALADELRAGAAEAVAALHAMKIGQTIMLTGDHRDAAGVVAAAAGIDRVEAELLPQQKLDTIRQLDRQFGGVAMVGDGVNDAPALAAATVGIAVGGAAGAGSDVALETADVVLLADDLRKLPQVIHLARFTQRIIRQNLLLALGVIVMLAPAAALGFTPISIAVLFHEGSTVIVVLNGLRILRHRQASRTS